MAITAFGPEPKKVTKKAAADLSSLQYCLMKLTAQDTVNKCTADTDIPYGILVNKPSAAGDPAVLWLLAEGGSCLLVVDGNAGAISAGTSNLTSDSLGKGVVTTGDNKYICARAMEASTAAGDIIAVEVFAAHRY